MREEGGRGGEGDEGGNKTKTVLHSASPTHGAITQVPRHHLSSHQLLTKSK